MGGLVARDAFADRKSRFCGTPLRRMVGFTVEKKAEAFARLVPALLRVTPKGNSASGETVGVFFVCFVLLLKI